MTNHKRRMSKLFWASTIYVVAAIAAVHHYHIGALGWLILGSTAVILYCLATAFEAVFDSLREMKSEDDA